MDPTYSSQGFDDTYSHTPRSRAGSGVSTTEGLLQNLHLAESTSFETGSYTTSRPSSSRGLASPAYLSPSLSHSPGYLSTPLTQHQTPFPPLSSEAVASDAECIIASAALYRDRSYEAPCLLVTVMESNNGLMPPHDLGPYGSDASLTPPSGSRSVTASPPRTNLTAEQRELKRQRDQARHNSKMQVRGRRTDSGSSVYSPPVTLSDMTTGASSMPVYTTAPSQISLLAEPSAPHYLPPFSPPLQDQNQAAMFTNSYPPQSYMPDYSYPPSTGPSLPSHYGLGMYPVPPIIPPGPQDASGQVRVVHSRPKPQCWEHGCNGRQFSTFSNLLRHQREKSGQAAKATCPNCGAEFTRTTARNGHLLHDKCKKKGSS
ncbi:hypothetical protein CHGG_05934 [Chaetomium globosum CBS 148.51]|uniref:C2H2-type domain-containing protein n=1 Tax=Chaetomium globosum (strain ATCC 6205 / CBS 148.51 / DSM 1962 / NBRC 6347 / NRRL 1970) TaxID=306901 RepID=Q2H5Y1_CHAGB|nr:uncharacterized protein CHGG_05934 [Chaetomium globosum CBS 148.51]EAQ89315.1 hypothetical protein CHGG_05934 [Chaetomium globosum CBS 148.51]